MGACCSTKVEGKEVEGKEAEGTGTGTAESPLLSGDEVAIIFSYLPPKDIMRARVNTTWRDAAKKATVPLCDFKVKGVKSYNALRAMSKALPNLQSITLIPLNLNTRLDTYYKYSDGEDPDESWAAELDDEDPCVDLDINFISNFSKLRVLNLLATPLNGRYSALFNFPLLQELRITQCKDLKVDLDTLGRLPSLKKLSIYGHINLTGDLNSLRPLRNTLEEIVLDCCSNVCGKLTDLADFHHLRKVNLWSTNVTGGFQDIYHLPTVKKMSLSSASG